MQKENIETFIYKLKNPQVYSGMEINVIKSCFGKDKINVCLVFPDTYEIGMSHQGIKILYHLLSRIDGVNVERSFLPDKESIELFKKEKIELFSLESKTPLKKFDVIGFSVLSEMNYTNILQVLSMSGIPLLTKERGGKFPLIIAGGITAASNPEPMRSFIDIFAIGDGEILFPKILETYKYRERKELKDFTSIKGLYVPSQHSKKSEIRKVVSDNINFNPFPNGLIVPITNVIFDRLEVEIARGCPQNCRFCQAKVYYSPYRIKEPEDIKTQLADTLKYTGFESFSLSSLSTGDHPYINELLNNIVNMKSGCLSVSFPSLRPSTLSGDILSTLSMGRKTGITIVPEAGSERLRKVINKEVSDEEILHAVKIALEHGWQKIKLYFMIGLPTETDDDLFETIRLVEKIIKVSRDAKKSLKIHISFSPFVPKPHTVFQWSRRDSSSEIYRKIDILKNGLKKYRNVDMDFHKPDKGIVETILSRGDHSVGELIFRAFSSGEIFSAWDSEFNFKIWEELIVELGLSKFLEEIDPDQPLPWDHIKINFKHDYLLSEYKRALNGKTTPSCSDMQCNVCDGCDFKYKKIPVISNNSDSRRLPHQENFDFNKVRIFYKKTGKFTWFSHLPMMRYIERLIRKANIPFKCTEGFHPRIKMGSIPPLPVFATGEEEVVELYIPNDLSEIQILNSLKSISEDFIFTHVEIVTERKNLNKDLKHILYTIKNTNPKNLKGEINSLLTSEDKAVFSENSIDLKIDYSNRGPERFSKIYRVIDPLKQNTVNLIRRKIVFKD